MEKMNQAFEKVKILVGMEVDEQSASSSSAPLQEHGSFSFMDMDEINRNCTLSTKQRFYGFAICLTAGLTSTLLSMLVFFNPVKFGITFTLGNLMALGSTAFLIGPKRQVNMMLDPVRIYATAIYLASIIVALFCALYVRNKLLTLLAIILEFGALICFLGGRSTFSKHVLILYEKSEMLFAKSGALTLPIIILWLLRPKYSLSYIPFARSMVSKIMVSCFDTEF